LVRQHSRVVRNLPEDFAEEEFTTLIKDRMGRGLVSEGQKLEKDIDDRKLLRSALEAPGMISKA
jgi:hypothetical protein